MLVTLNNLMDANIAWVFYSVNHKDTRFLDQLQIFWQSHLTELLGLSIGQGLLDLQHLIYPWLFTGFGMLVLFTNVSLAEFQVKYLPLFCHFSVIGGIKLFWMGRFCKNIQLMLVFLKAPSLVFHFSYSILKTFLVALSVILLSLLMILLSIRSSVMRHLICGNNLGWLLNNHNSRCQGFPSHLNWIGDVALSLLLKLPQKL